MVLDRLRRKKKEGAPAIVRSEFLKIRPIRNPRLRWEKNESEAVTVIIPLEKPVEKKETKKESKITKKKKPSPPKEKRIQLDVLGSIVWELCDGEKTVKDIVDSLYEKYKLLPSESEVSLNTYFNQLAKRGLVGFILPEETRARYEEAAKKAMEKKQQKTTG